MATLWREPSAALSRNPILDRRKQRISREATWARPSKSVGSRPFVPFVCFCSKSSRRAKKQNVSRTDAFSVCCSRGHGRRTGMSRMMLLVMLGACLMASGCVAPHCGGFACGPGARCDDCVPPWVSHCGHYRQRLDDKVTRMTALKCAWHGLESYRGRGGGAVSSDFAAGFEQAYVDLAENRTPQPPSLPPSKYWSAFYRSCAGRPYVEDWFAGYHAGLEMGLHSGVSRFNQIEVRSCSLGAEQGGGMRTHGTGQPYGNGMATSSGPGCSCRAR